MEYPTKHGILQAEMLTRLAVNHNKRMLLATNNADFWKEHLEGKFPDAHIEEVNEGLMISRRK